MNAGWFIFKARIIKTLSKSNWSKDIVSVRNKKKNAATAANEKKRIAYHTKWRLDSDKLHLVH